MTELLTPFATEIAANKNATQAPGALARIETATSSLNVRLRGCYITACELTGLETGARIGVLYSDPNITVPKINASHVMMPVGSSKGIGGGHGFARWADYKELPLADGPAGEKQIAIQAKRPDNGLSLTKSFRLTGSALTSLTNVYNPGTTAERTSLGEHLYFDLAGEQFEGFRINGQTLDELMGEGAEVAVKNDDTLEWYDFDGEALVEFPAGHSIRLSAEFTGDTELPLSIGIWHRRGTPSVCVEPIVGVRDDRNDGIKLIPYTGAGLLTKIELL